MSWQLARRFPTPTPTYLASLEAEMLAVKSGARTGNGAEHQAGAGASSEQQPQADNSAPACSLAPHIDNFEEKHGSLDSRKKIEYMFLYSAQAHCLTCMEFYSSMEKFNVKCTSCGKTARQWAATSRNRRGRQAVDIPLDVEAWLQAHDL